MSMAMIEIVARAIAQADEQNGGPPYDHRIGMGKHAREHLFDQARAAITAYERGSQIKEGGMNQFKDHRTPLMACPYCAKVLDADPHDRTAPGNGDITLCVGCGEWCIFTNNLTLRKPTDEEQLEIGHDPHCIIARRAWNKLLAIINEGAV